MFGFRLRFLALLQFFYDLWRWRSWPIAVASFKVEVLAVALKGHLNARHFTDFGSPTADEPRTGPVWGSSIQLAGDNLGRIEREGRALSNTLSSYARVQRRHLDRCERCQREVAATFAGAFSGIGKARSEGARRSDVQ